MKFIRVILAIITLLILGTGVLAEMKPITGKPVIDSSELLEWPYDSDIVIPALNDPISNTLHDFHAEISSCDLCFSSEGNYHPALRDGWPIFFAKFKDQPLRNWFYTTSPSVAVPQLDRQVVQFGNLYAKCRPQVVVTAGGVMKQLEGAGIPRVSPTLCTGTEDR